MKSSYKLTSEQGEKQAEEDEPAAWETKGVPVGDPMPTEEERLCCKDGDLLMSNRGLVQRRYLWLHNALSHVGGILVWWDKNRAELSKR